MSDFEIYPAIDLRFGQVVRLSQGRANQQTTYSDDPAAVAEEWIEQGAKWLHVVNLNGAFGEKTQENESAIHEIINAGKNRLRVQLGGGIRSFENIDTILSMGASRVVLGTAAIEDPQFGIETLKRFGSEKIAFGFDAIEGKLMTRGWLINSEVSMITLGERFAEAGARTLIYTNINKDGMQKGVDWETGKSLADQTGLAVIASGGTSSLDNIAIASSSGLAGIIVGRALYEGNFTLEEALNVC